MNINQNEKTKSKSVFQVFQEYIDFLCYHLTMIETESHKRHFLSTVEIKHYNVNFDGKNLIKRQPVNNDIRTYEKIRKIATGQGLIDYFYIKRNFKPIVIELGKQQKLDVNLKPVQQIKFTTSLDCAEDTYMMFILEEKVKETIFDFSQGTASVLQFLNLDVAWLSYCMFEDCQVK